jgi:hypothetical protein
LEGFFPAVVLVDAFFVEVFLVEAFLSAVVLVDAFFVEVFLVEAFFPAVFSPISSGSAFESDGVSLAGLDAFVLVAAFLPDVAFLPAGSFLPADSFLPEVLAASPLGSSTAGTEPSLPEEVSSEDTASSGDGDFALDFFAGAFFEPLDFLLFRAKGLSEPVGVGAKITPRARP